MFYLVGVDCNSMAASAIYPVQWMGLMMICCGMAVMGVRMLGINVRKMKALTVKIKGH